MTSQRDIEQIFQRLFAQSTAALQRTSLVPILDAPPSKPAPGLLWVRSSEKIAYIQLHDGTALAVGTGTSGGGGGSGANLADRSVPAVKLVLNSLTSSEIGDAAVGTSELAGAAVTGDKLASEIVATTRLNLTGSVTGSPVLSLRGTSGHTAAIFATMLETSQRFAVRPDNVSVGETLTSSSFSVQAANPADTALVRIRGASGPILIAQSSSVAENLLELDAAGNLKLRGSITAGGGSGTSGSFAVNGALTVQNQTNLLGGLQVTGAADLLSTLRVRGATTFDQALVLPASYSARLGSAAWLRTTASPNRVLIEGVDDTSVAELQLGASGPVLSGAASQPGALRVGGKPVVFANGSGAAAGLLLGSQIALDTITGGNGVGVGNIAGNSIYGYNLRDYSVTRTKLSPGAVGSTEIGDSQITTQHVASLSVSRLASGTINADEIFLGPSGAIYAGPVSHDTLAEARVVLDFAGLRAITSAGATVASLTPGAFSLRSSNGADRLELNPTSGLALYQAGQVTSQLAPNGTFTLAAVDTGGSARLTSTEGIEFIAAAARNLVFNPGFEGGSGLQPPVGAEAFDDQEHVFNGEFSAYLRSIETNIVSPSYVDVSFGNTVGYGTTVMLPSRANACPNPALGVNATGWSGADGAGTAASRVAVSGFERPNAMRLTVALDGVAEFVLPTVSCSPGQPWTTSLALRVSRMRECYIRVQFLDAANAVVRERSSATLLAAPDRVLRLGVAGEAPVGATKLRVMFSVPEAVAGDVIDVSCALYERIAGEDAYADGYTSGWVWSGTEGASASSLPAQSYADSALNVVSVFVWSDVAVWGRVEARDTTAGVSRGVSASQRIEARRWSRLWVVANGVIDKIRLLAPTTDQAAQSRFTASGVWFSGLQVEVAAAATSRPSPLVVGSEPGCEWEGVAFASTSLRRNATVVTKFSPSFGAATSGALVGGTVSGSSIFGSRIVGSQITGSRIIGNQIDGAQIETSTLGQNALAVGVNNLIADGGFEDWRRNRLRAAPGWSFPSRSVVDDLGISVVRSGRYAARSAPDPTVSAPYTLLLAENMQASPGERMFASFYARRDNSANGSVELRGLSHFDFKPRTNLIVNPRARLSDAGWSRFINSDGGFQLPSLRRVSPSQTPQNGMVAKFMLWRANYHPNPSLENNVAIVDTTSTTSAALFTWTHVTTGGGVDGKNYVRAVAKIAREAAFAVGFGAFQTLPGYHQFVCSMYVRTSARRSVRMIVRNLLTTGSYSSEFRYGSYFVLEPNVWTQVFALNPPFSTNQIGVAMWLEVANVVSGERIEMDQLMVEHGTVPGPYFDGSSDVFSEWQAEVDASPSFWYNPVYRRERVNLCQNPTAHRNLTNWSFSGPSGSSITRQVGSGVDAGTWNVMFNLGSSINFSHTVMPPQEIDPNCTYTVTCETWALEATQCQIMIHMYNSDNINSLGTSLGAIYSALITIPAQTWIRHTFTFRPTATAKFMRPHLQWNNGIGGRNYFTRKVLYERTNAVLPYFDGTLAASNAYNPPWMPSSMTATPVWDDPSFGLDASTASLLPPSDYRRYVNLCADGRPGSTPQGVGNLDNGLLWPDRTWNAASASTTMSLVAAAGSDPPLARFVASAAVTVRAEAPYIGNRDVIGFNLMGHAARYTVRARVRVKTGNGSTVVVTPIILVAAQGRQGLTEVTYSTFTVTDNVWFNYESYVAMRQFMSMLGVSFTFAAQAGWSIDITDVMYVKSYNDTVPASFYDHPNMSLPWQHDYGIAALQPVAPRGDVAPPSVPVVAGRSYAFTADFYRLRNVFARLTPTITATVWWLNASSAWLSKAPVSIASSTPRTFSGVVTAPTNAAFARIFVTVTDGSDNLEIFFDRIAFAESAVEVPFFDGFSAHAVWNGSPGASSSFQDNKEEFTFQSAAAADLSYAYVQLNGMATIPDDTQFIDVYFVGLARSQGSIYVDDVEMRHVLSSASRLGQRAVLSPFGLELFDPGEDLPSVSLVAGQDNYLTLRRAGSGASDTAVAISSDGVGSFEDVDVSSQFKYKGVELADYIFSSTNKTVALGEWTTTTAYLAGQQLVFEISVYLEPNRNYTIHADPVLVQVSGATTGKAARCFIIYTTDGTAPTLGKASIAFNQQVCFNDVNLPVNKLFSTGTTRQLYRFGLCVDAWTNSTLRLLATTAESQKTRMWVTDEGPLKPNLAVANTGNSSASVVRLEYSQQYPATAVFPYDDRGFSVKSDIPTEMVQGFNPSDSIGNRSSVIWFDSAAFAAAFSGATITGVRLYLYMKDWYYENGGVVVLGTHASPPSASGAAHLDDVASKIYNRFQYPNWPRASGRWVTLPTTLGDEIKGGTVTGFLLGPGLSTDPVYYGRGQGSLASDIRPILEVTYVK